MCVCVQNLPVTTQASCSQPAPLLSSWRQKPPARDNPTLPHLCQGRTCGARIPLIPSPSFTVTIIPGVKKKICKAALGDASPPPLRGIQLLKVLSQGGLIRLAVGNAACSEHLSQFWAVPWKGWERETEPELRMTAGEDGGANRPVSGIQTAKDSQSCQGTHPG